MKSYVLALDQGTTSSRALLFDCTGKVIALTQREFPQYFPAPGLVEHDANEIWRSQLAVARQVMQEANVAASEVAALGIANQRETTVVWDRASGEPVHNAIVWQDRRTARRCEELRRAGKEAAVHARTGLLLDPYFSASKLEWLLENVPGLRRRGERGELAFGTVDSWLAFKLCGRHVTDPSNAARTLLFDIHKCAWDDELLALFNVPRSMLAEVVPTSGVVGDIDPSLLGGSIPLASLAGDQQAACFGQACLSPGMAKNTYGTGCFMLMNTGLQPVDSKHQLLSSIAWTREGDAHAARPRYVLEGSVFTAGAVVQWLRDGLGLIASSPDVEPLAASVPDSAGVYFVPAFTGLGAPYWDADARGAIVGLTRGSTGAHIARAALESIAYQSAELLLAMQQDADMPIAELRVDGGAARNNFLMQFQANLSGLPVVRPAITETTAAGAAYLAGLATGIWAEEAQVAEMWKQEKRFFPEWEPARRSERMHDWRAAVKRTRSE
ncbi:MAG: glpK [Paucimonas sp.]|nr:glpK [Paucimonas sp.]